MEVRPSTAAHLVLTSEARLWRTGDGAHYGATSFGYATLQRYLTTFDRLTVVCRVSACQEPPSGATRVDGPDVAVCGLAPYEGPIGFGTASPWLAREIRRAIPRQASLLLRVPSPIAGLALRSASGRRTFGLEVVGDPQDVLAPGVVQHPLRPLLQRTAVRQLKRQCSSAAVAIYVTQQALQQRYPVGPQGQSFAASNVALDDAAFADHPPRPELGALHLVTVASLAQRYKGVDVLLEAVAGLRARGLAVELDVVGTGRYRHELEQQAHRLGLSEDVTFRGELDKRGVQRALDHADVFVLASRTEGLPRALLEAMARSLPCVATSVGGVPELLSAELLAPPGDPLLLREKLHELLADPGRAAAEGQRNRQVAARYHGTRLQSIREQAYARLLDVTSGSASRRST